MGLARGPAEFAREQGVRAGEDAEHACEGVLAFDAEGGSRLRLTAASAAAFPDLDEDRFAVHGLDEQGAAYTLLDAVLVSSEGQLFSGLRDVEIVGFLLIRGTHVLAVADLVFDRAVLAISGLVELLGQPPAPELESLPPRLADGPIQHVVPCPAQC